MFTKILDAISPGTKSKLEELERASQIVQALNQETERICEDVLISLREARKTSNIFEAAAKQKILDQAQKRGSRLLPKINNNLSTARILVVEDDKFIADTVIQQIAEKSQLNIKLDHARNLADMLRLVKENKYNCIILDLKLPDSQDRFETINKITGIINIPVIVLTGDDSIALQIHALENHIKYYLLKNNTSHNLLLLTVCQALEESRIKHV